MSHSMVTACGAGAAALSALVLLAAPAQAAVSVNGASTNVTVAALGSRGFSGPFSDPHSFTGDQIQPLTSAPPSASSIAGEGGGVTAISTASLTATWAAAAGGGFDPLHGNILADEFRVVGSAFGDGDLGFNGESATLLWSYDVTFDSDTTFKADFSFLNAVGDTTHMGQWTVQAVTDDANQTVIPLGGLSDLDGSIAQLLSAGSYKLQILVADDASQFLQHGVSGSLRTSIDWSLTPEPPPVIDPVGGSGGGGGAVPEPAAWALMICGFGLAGSALRRRQATVRAAA